jgi:hypothetical protein
MVSQFKISPTNYSSKPLTRATKMKEDMIYEENKPSFEDLIKNLEDLRNKMQLLNGIINR